MMHLHQRDTMRPGRRTLGRGAAGLRATALLALCLGACLGGHVGVDAGVDAGYTPIGDQAPLCRSNNDGVIDRSELIFPVGATVRYLSNPQDTTVSVSPAGTSGAGGITWDLSATDGDVHEFTLLPVSGQWFEASFPGASYAVVSDVASGTLGIYRVTDDAVLLLGFASPTAGASQTLLIYDQPVATLRFPLTNGAGWVTSGRITNGRLMGQPFASTDTYRISIDAEGTAVLPFLRFQNTLRVHVELTQALPGGIAVHHIQHIFMHECYGELGRMSSQAGENDPAFTMAAEFRRLAL